MAIEEQIKRAATTGKVIAGAKECEKAILLGQAKFVFMSQDLDEQAKEKFLHILKVGKVPYKELAHSYLEMGEIIGKGHPAGVLAVLDEGKAKIELK